MRKKTLITIYLRVDLFFAIGNRYELQNITFCKTMLFTFFFLTFKAKRGKKQKDQKMIFCDLSKETKHPRKGNVIKNMQKNTGS